jgi:hypothetical protein
MIRATTDLKKSNITLHVCHCGQSVTVRDALRELNQSIEKIAELNPVAEKQLSLRINSSVIPANAGILQPSNGLRLAPE